MKTARIHQFGSPEVTVIDDLERPTPGLREPLVRVAAAGAEEVTFKTGEGVYGATKKDCCGAYTDYALASGETVARMPMVQGFVEAASGPVVVVTAWPMLFHYAQAKAGQTVLIHGAASNVSAHAMQLAALAGLHAYATADSDDLEYVQKLYVERVVEYGTTKFEDTVPLVDVVIDTVGGDTRGRSFRLLHRANDHKSAERDLQIA